MFCPMGPQHHCHSPTQWTCPFSSAGWPWPWGTRWWHPGPLKPGGNSLVPRAYIGNGTQVDHGDLWITFRVIFYLFLEDNCVWSWVALLSCPVDPRKPIAFPHSIFLIPFVPSQQCFYWYNPISVPGFSRDDWLNLWVISSWNAHHELLLFSPSRAFSFFAMWTGWEFSMSSSSGSFLLNNSFNWSLSSHILL